VVERVGLEKVLPPVFGKGEIKEFLKPIFQHSIGFFYFHRLAANLLLQRILTEWP